ncbi:MAG: PAS domain-containing protein [Pyrinomonadaceae bacterium]
MSVFPAAVTEFVIKLTAATRMLVNLRIRPDGTLVEIGGALYAYGLRDIPLGQRADESLPFLFGILPLEKSPMFLPYVTTDTGAVADIYLWKDGEDTRVIMLDATQDARKRQAIQQEAHDLGLELHRHERTTEKLQVEKDQLESLVESRTRSLANANYQLIQEIAEREKTEEALRSSEARFRRVSESNIIGIMFWDLSGTITEANDAFLDAIGYDRNDLVGGDIRWDSITLPELRHLDDSAIEEMRERGAFTPFEKTFIRKDGTRTKLLFGAALLEGSQQQTVCFTMDLSRWK